jgi:hypothetical protein
VSKEDKTTKVEAIDAGKALPGKPGKQLREGEKPSAPANLVIPKPVVIPAPPSNNSDKK